mgnify:CR=1 FL=1
MKTQYKKTEESFRNILWKAGFIDQSVKGLTEVANYLHVTLPTIYRWIKYNRPSKQALNMLSNRDRNLDKNWDGFKINKNKIRTPNGYEYSTTELQKLALEIERLKALYS